MNSEREQEKNVKTGTFFLKIPNPAKKQEEKLLNPAEKTSLFVPKIKLLEKSEFKPATFSNKVYITRNIAKVLEAVFKHGAIGKRYGEGGLENDPTRQQVIVYTMITCQKNLLWYKRTSPKDVSKKVKKFLGEPRLQGKTSVGFGGHKTKEDVEIGVKELIFLEELIPVIRDEIGTLLGLSKGFFNEVQEELGIQRSNIKSVKLLGAFFDERFEDPSVEIQAGWVHTGISAVIEIDPESISTLSFTNLEVTKAWWVPFKEVEKEFIKRKSQCESWTEIVLKEFWPEVRN